METGEGTKVQACVVVGVGWVVGYMGNIETAPVDLVAGPLSRSPRNSRRCAKNFRPSLTSHRNGLDPILVSLRITGLHMERETWAQLRTMGKVVPLIFLFPPFSQHPARREDARYRRDPDGAGEPSLGGLGQGLGFVVRDCEWCLVACENKCGADLCTLWAGWDEFERVWKSPNFIDGRVMENCFIIVTVLLYAQLFTTRMGHTIWVCWHLCPWAAIWWERVGPGKGLWWFRWVSYWLTMPRNQGMGGGGPHSGNCARSAFKHLSARSCSIDGQTTYRLGYSSASKMG